MAALVSSRAARRAHAASSPTEGTGQAEMRQPGADARGARADGGGAGVQGLGPDRNAGDPVDPSDLLYPGQPGPDPGYPAGARAPRAAGPDSHYPGRDDARPRLPPGQYVQPSLPVLHYGPVPAFNPQTWDLRVYGETA